MSVLESQIALGSYYSSLQGSQPSSVRVTNSTREGTNAQIFVKDDPLGYLYGEQVLYSTLPCSCIMQVV